MAKATTEMYRNEWQLNKTLAQRNAYMLENGIATDVTFVVSNETTDLQKTFAVHKYMLISASPVFFAMFCGGFPVSDNIHIDDVDPAAFQEMLRFIYTEDVRITGDVVLQIMHASKKYNIPALTARCTTFLEDEMRPDNVCMLFEHSEFFGEKEISRKCINLISEETAEVLDSDAFLQISQPTLVKILELNCLTSDESDLFDSCMHWAIAKLSKTGKGTHGQEIREILGNALYKIRFPTMPMEEFSTKVSKSGVLTKDEELDVFRYLAMDKKLQNASLPFSTVERNGLSIKPNELFLSPDILKTVKSENFTGAQFQSSISLIGSEKMDIKGFLIALPCTDKQPTAMDGLAIQINCQRFRQNHQVRPENTEVRRVRSLNFLCTAVPVHNVIVEPNRECAIGITFPGTNFWAKRRQKRRGRFGDLAQPGGVFVFGGAPQAGIFGNANQHFAMPNFGHQPQGGFAQAEAESDTVKMYHISSPQYTLKGRNREIKVAPYTPSLKQRKIAMADGIRSDSYPILLIGVSV